MYFNDRGFKKVCLICYLSVGIVLYCTSVFDFWTLQQTEQQIEQDQLNRLLQGACYSISNWLDVRQTDREEQSKENGGCLDLTLLYNKYVRKYHIRTTKQQQVAARRIQIDF